MYTYSILHLSQMLIYSQQILQLGCISSHLLVFFFPILWQHSVRNSLSKVYEVVVGAMLQAEPTELGAWYH